MTDAARESRVAIVTGGSRGIGRATAMAAATHGWRVVIGYVSNAAAARETVAAIEAGNGKAMAVRCDVGIESDILGLFKAADDFGTLGALVNNAGIVGPTARVEALTADRIDHMLRVNVTGSFLCAREAVKRLRQYLCRLRGLERRHRYLHHRALQRSRGRGHSRRRYPAGAYRHGDSCQRRRTRAPLPAGENRADAARGHRGRNRQRHRLADVGRGVLCHRHHDQCFRRALIPPLYRQD